MNHLDKGVKNKVVGIKPEGRMPVRDGALIEDESGTEVGKVTSGGLGPSLEKPIAIARVRIKSIDNKSKLFALVRGKKIPIEIVKLPFVKQNYFRG